MPRSPPQHYWRSARPPTGPRRTELPLHSSATCFVHSCWEPIGGGVTQSVRFLDAGHPSRQLPWRESYGDVVEDAVPLIDLWSAS